MPILYAVFDVDIGDGEPVRKLPYNRAGNLYNDFHLPAPSTKAI